MHLGATPKANYIFRDLDDSCIVLIFRALTSA
jgi:hypothetical protein